MTPQFGASLADDSRVVIYDRNRFIVQATGLTHKHMTSYKTETNTLAYFKPTRVEHMMLSHPMAPGLTPKHIQRQKRIVRDKHSSLLRPDLTEEMQLYCTDIIYLIKFVQFILFPIFFSIDLKKMSKY